VRRVIERTKPKEMIFKSLVKDYFLENPKVDKALVEIKEDKLTRSQAQNKLYFMWIDDYIRQELGYSKKETHKALVEELLGYDVTTGFNEKEITSLKETKDMKVAEFARYLEEVDRLCAGLGIKLPYPDYYWLAMGVKAP
jgi:16S rRNA A1518/A1519 N6-dimethyltransferase RsmA/KsgA/DIM1 with predicted DNA glycosylase/AP lyase activity